MGRPASTAGGRPNTVTVRLSDAEARALDRMRGPITRGEMFRRLLFRALSGAPPGPADTPSQIVDSAALTNLESDS